MRCAKTLLILMALVLSLASTAAYAESDDVREQRDELFRNIAEAHYERASLLSEQGKPDEAVAELREILGLPFSEHDKEERDQQTFQIHMSIFEVYVDAERYDAAEKLMGDILPSVAGQPHRQATLHNMLGHMFRDQEQDAKAMEHFSKAIELSKKALANLESQPE